MLIGAIGVIVVGIVNAADGARARVAARPPVPAGYTADGRPFYPIVGYTPDGAPVTADRAASLQPGSAGTNTMAIMALIFAFVATPLAIPFGHIARSQIRRTGEGGAGMALAGLILGYLWCGIILLVGIAAAVLIATQSH